MTADDRLRAAWAWLVGPRGVMAFAVALLFALMVASFVNIPWDLPAQKCGDSLCEIPVTPGSAEPSIGETLFGPYAILVLLSALVLAACMIGGVYLAKSEGGP